MTTPETRRSFPVEWARDQFPAVRAAERLRPPLAFMDNAGGAQVPARTMQYAVRYFTELNVQLGALYGPAVENTRLFDSFRPRMGELLGARSPDEVIYGANATTIMRLFSTSFRETLKRGDEVIVTSLDHEANVTPWLRLQMEGIKVRFWEPRGPEARLVAGDLKALLNDRIRLVAVTACSNLLGTITGVAELAPMVHDAGAILFVDGVHAAPHLRVNAARDDVDVFVCSGYKIFGPHMGFAICRGEVLQRIPSLNHYFLKLKLELGSQNYEGVAAMAGTLDYFLDLAMQLGIAAGPDLFDRLFEHIAAYERTLTEALVAGLSSIEGVTVHGISDPANFNHRVPTAAFSVRGKAPDEVADLLAKAGLGVQHGHMYAARIVEWLRLKDKGGVTRASLCHYNTAAEVERLLEAVSDVAK